MAEAGHYRSVLAIRDARTLIVATAASELGDWLYNAALLAYVYAATGSAAWVGAATICRLLPYVLLGPAGGLVADRFDRRAVLIAGDAVRCALMLVLAVVVAAGGSTVLVIALTAAASAAGAAQRPAAMALLPRLVGESRLGAANALFHTVSNTGIVVGPAMGAVILAVSSAWVAFFVNGLTFAVSAAFETTIRKRPVVAAPVDGGPPDGTDGTNGANGGPPGAGRQLVDGVRAAFTTPFVLPLFTIVTMSAFTYGAQSVQLVLYAEQRLDLGDAGYGWFLALMGVGGVLSALITGRIAGTPHVGAVAVVAASVFGATQLAYATNDVVAIAMIVTLLGGIGSVAGDVVAETAIARVVPGEMLGRVMGVFDALSVAAMVLGAAVAPLVTSWTSLRTGMVVLGSATLVVLLCCPLGLRGLAEANRRREAQLASRIAVIEALPITAGIPRLAIEQMASAAEISPVPAGIDVVIQGSPAQAFYAVVEGRVEVRRDGAVVDHIDAGGHFGERGLLDNAPRNATVATEVDSVLLRLPGDVLLDALQLAPTLRATLDRSNAPAWKPSDGDAVPFVDDPDWPG